MVALYLHLGLSGGGSHPCIFVSYITVVNLCCILSLYKNIKAGIQSYKIVFVALSCNIQCTFHRSYPMKTRNFTLRKIQLFN